VLVDLIRSLYSLPVTSNLKICFVDEEQDIILISSDHELLYAAELVQPLKLVITTVSIPLEQPQARVEPSQVASLPKLSGEDKKKWRHEMQTLTKEQKISAKIARITERIKHIEALLLTDLPAHSHRALSWRVEKLQGKLECLQLLSDTLIQNTEVPTFVASQPEDFERRGCRGRGGRGGCRGRRTFESNEAPEGCRKQWGPLDKQIWQCRQDWRAARAAGNQEQTDACSKALDEAKALKWEAKREGKPEQPKNFCEGKQHKRECMKNLREAKASGDPEKIKECVNALIEAREAWQKAKVVRRC